MCFFIITCSKLDNDLFVGAVEGSNIRYGGRVPEALKNRSRLTNSGQELVWVRTGNESEGSAGAGWGNREQNLFLYSVSS